MNAPGRFGYHRRRRRAAAGKNAQPKSDVLHGPFAEPGRKHSCPNAPDERSATEALPPGEVDFRPRGHSRILIHAWHEPAWRARVDGRERRMRAPILGGQIAVGPCLVKAGVPNTQNFFRRPEIDKSCPQCGRQSCDCRGSPWVNERCGNGYEGLEAEARFAGTSGYTSVFFSFPEWFPFRFLLGDRLRPPRRNIRHK